MGGWSAREASVVPANTPMNEASHFPQSRMSNIQPPPTAAKTLAHNRAPTVTNGNQI
jgi:hypothetical protein